MAKLEEYDRWFKRAKKKVGRYQKHKTATEKQRAHRDKIKIWQEPREKVVMPMYRGGG